VSLSFQGHWRAHTLWGVLPVDGIVTGRLTYVQTPTATRMHFAYTTSSGVVQQQWAVWERGGRHATLAHNATWLHLSNGSTPSHPVLAWSCAVVEEGRATDANNPAFCGHTREVHFRFDGFMPAAGEAQSTPAGEGLVERWRYDHIKRAPNATLTLLLQRPSE
jgi:hypothetical protein